MVSTAYHDERYHAFVEVKQEGKSRWLDEILMEKGYVRIHTKPAKKFLFSL